jgi:hypothetical protein
MLVIIAEYFTLGGLPFHINLVTIWYHSITHLGICIHLPRESNCDKNNVLTTKIFSFKFWKHHCLARFSMLIICDLKISSTYLFKSFPMTIPNNVTFSGQIASPFYLLSFKPKHVVNLSSMRRATWSISHLRKSDMYHP